jgi:photosystem II stability/assembly factor-like uncharacterized protein
VIAFKERGPGNVPGRTRGLIVDPDDGTHKTWFAGSVSGGIWKTSDAGNNWQWITPTIPNLSTSCMAMAESNHNVIYAGTGEGFGSVDGINGMGILKSIDKGATWSVLQNSAVLANVNRIAIDPSNENYVLAACNAGIFLSTDGGNSWSKVYSGVVQDLRATPGNFSVLYAGQRNVGVIKSTDKGVTWTMSNTAMSPKTRVEIAISPVKTDRLLASVDGTLSGVSSDLYFSDNGGTTWSLVTLSLNNKTIDYLGGQGWYDNTVAFSPYDKDVAYIGGVSTFQVTLGAPVAGTSGSYTFNEVNTKFLSLTTFQSATTAGSRLSTGAAANTDTVELRFGPGISQKAYRFLVPVGATSGVPDANYSYQDYVDVPFQVWDLKKNQQLMVSFRDQGRNGVFDLIKLNTSATDPTLQSREYIYINNVPYSTTPNSSIATQGGHTFQEMYFFWPTLDSTSTWTPTALPSSQLQIVYSTLSNYSSTLKSVSDPYGNYGGINNRNFVHPDQHNIFPIKQNDAQQTYQLLMANDGGVFLSSTSTSPGTTQGEWNKVGIGYNTSQMYGADKKPGAEEYLGGMQDNSTYYTPAGVVGSPTTAFVTNSMLAGDGFEVLWHSFDGNKMIGGAYNDNFARTTNGGTTWSTAFSGMPLKNSIPDPAKFPFISQLACSKQTPDKIYTVGLGGVWKSDDFGGNWTLTAMDTGWGNSSDMEFADVEVSRANPNIVWAGSGQYGSVSLFVSTNAGQTFSSVPNPVGFTLGNITRIATHPFEANTAYVLYSFAKTAKIFKTTDLGQTWTDISGFGTGQTSSTGFPDVAVFSMYVRPDNTNIIWAGTEIGIVESLDGGNTWAMLTTFPAVAVWDMRGQDNEIVIATHGRGIWTATLNNDQTGASRIVASGTSPQSKFKMIINVPFKYDSVIVQFNSSSAVKFFPPDTGTYKLQIANVPLGSLSMQTISYKGGIPTASALTPGANLMLTTYQQKYFDYIVNGNNFYLDGFTVTSFGLSNSSLQSKHNYAANKSTSATLLVPIIVSASNSTFIFDNVTLVQPGATGSVFGKSSFNDYVIAEATKDGLTWIPIANGYNSSANAGWLSAYNASTPGAISMIVTENFDLKTNFNAGDTLLVRFRLFSNDDNIVSWGWSVDNLYVQQTPMAVEPSPLSDAIIYPNPSSGKFTVHYSLSKDSEVAMNVWDVTGRNVLNENFGQLSTGKNESELNLEGLPDGIYLVRVKTIDGERTIKIAVRK